MPSPYLLRRRDETALRRRAINHCIIGVFLGAYQRFRRSQAAGGGGEHQRFERRADAGTGLSARALRMP